jgi:predicted Zn-ribbon and HTH transcriptional regulator
VTEVNAASALFIVPDVNDCQHKLDDLHFNTVTYAWLILVGLRPLACWDCGYEFRRDMVVFLLRVLCVVR